MLFAHGKMDGVMDPIVKELGKLALPWGHTTKVSSALYISELMVWLELSRL